MRAPTSAPVRILHTVHAYPPDVGGSEAVVSRLSEGLLARGHEVAVATSAHADRGPEVEGVPVHGFPAGPAGALAYRRFVHEGMRDGRWDVVMTYHSKVWSHLALAPFRTVGPAWVYAPTEFTDLDSRHPRHLAYYRTLEPASLRRAKRVVVLTKADEERAVTLGGERVRARVRRIPNGTDHGWWSKGRAGKVRDRLGLPEDAPLALFTGALWPHKEVETLARALAQAPGVHLAVAGPQRGRADAVRAAARAAGTLDRVHLVGPIERDVLRKLYHTCDVHASASNNEGFGLTYLEAMACGKPVVARAVGVVPELVGEGAAVHVAHDPSTFGAAILQAIDEGGGKNRELAKAYDWEVVLDRFEACYEEVAR